MGVRDGQDLPQFVKFELGFEAVRSSPESPLAVWTSRGRPSNAAARGATSRPRAQHASRCDSSPFFRATWIRAGVQVRSPRHSSDGT